jgi:CRP-like cAMP-binding protein
MSGATILLNVAYTVLLSASFFRSLLRLRIVLIVGAIGFVAYGLVQSNATIALWNGLNASLHGVQLAKLMRARRSVELTPEEEELRHRYFPEMSPFDFFAWWSLGRPERIEGTITEQGTDQVDLVLILSGKVSVDVDGRDVAVRGPGDFIGEASLFSGGQATATVRTIGPIEARVWEHRQIRTLDELNPGSARAVQACLSRSLVDKIAR